MINTETVKEFVKQLDDTKKKADQRGCYDNLLDSVFDQPIESDKWKNLHFSTCGLSLLSLATFASEQEAKDTLKERVPLLLSGQIVFGLGRPFYLGNLRSYHAVDCKEVYVYSHSIQVPYKEE